MADTGVKEQPEGTELLLEPSEHPAVKPFKNALVKDGIPATSFQVQDLNAEFARLHDLGVVFTVEPMDAGTVRMAVLDDSLWEPHPTGRDEMSGRAWRD